MNSDNNSNAMITRGTAYDRYKQTTRGFRDALAKLIPSKLRLVSVADLARAADHVLVESKSTPNNTGTTATANACNSNVINMQIDRSLLDDLEEAIRLREAVGATYAEGNQDDGHHYVIQVLKYCRNVLVQSRLNLRKSRASKRRSNSSSGGSERNKAARPEITSAINRKEHDSVDARFSALQVDSDSDSEEDNSSTASSSSSVTVEEEDTESTFDHPAEPPSDYSIENDLIQGSLTFQANLFFLSAENLFSLVVEAYETLSDGMDQLQSSGQSFQYVNHHTVLLLLQSTATVNLVMERTKCLEKAFFLEHGDPFHNIYHVFAVLIFSNQIRQMEEILGQKTIKHNPFLCVNLAAFCVQFGFIGQKMYLSGNIESILEDILFAKKKHNVKHTKVASQQQLEQVTDVCYTISASADMERMFDPDFFKEADVIDVRFLTKPGTLRSVQIVFPHWLRNYGCLGGRSGILHTFAQLEKSRMEPPSEEEYDAARLSEVGLSLESTRQVMDTLYCRRLFPLLWGRHSNNMFKWLPVLHRNTQFSLCLPVLRSFGHMMDQQGMSVEFAMAFGIHALVYGTFLLEKHNHCRRVAVVSKLAVQKFEKQIDELTGSTYLSSLESMRPRLTINLACLPLFVELQKEERGFVRALWNPLLAGSFLLTAAFHSNLELGFETSDGAFQIRTVLHLYNALKQRSFVPKIEVLEVLQRTLESSSTCWPEGKPERNGFLKSFFLASGDFSRVIDQYVEFLKIEDSDEERLNAILAPGRRAILSTTNHLDATQQTALVRAHYLFGIRSHYGKRAPVVAVASPYAASTAYKYFKFQDFPRPVSSLRTDDLTVCHQQAQLLNDAIGKDDDLLSINWIKTGFVFDSFVSKLLDDLKITALVDELRELKIHPAHACPTLAHERACLGDIANKFLADRVFRELEFQEKDEDCIKSLKVAEIMSDFFRNTATKDTITFF